VKDQLASLEKRLGPGDRTRIAEYFDSIRDIERRIQRAEEQSDRGDFPEIESVSTLGRARCWVPVTSATPGWSF
jgi:hypothetical protein